MFVDKRLGPTRKENILKNQLKQKNSLIENIKYLIINSQKKCISLQNKIWQIALKTLN